MACVTIADVKAKSLLGKLNGPNDNPVGPFTDVFLNDCIAEVERNRQQLIRDYGCSNSSPSSNNTVPDLIALEVAHKAYLQLLLEAGETGDPIPLGAVSEGTLTRGGSTSRIKRAIKAYSPEEIIGEGYYTFTPWGLRWYRLWIALAPEMTTVNRPGASRGPLPIAYGVFRGGRW